MINYYYSSGTGLHKHASFIPDSFRMLVVGSSNSGKTTLLMRMLLEPRLLDYDKLYIFSMSLHQPEYKVLKAGFENHLTKKNIIRLLNSGEQITRYQNEPLSDEDDDIPTIESVARGLAETQTRDSHLVGEFHNSAEEVPDPSELDTSIRNLMIFDDLMDRSQKIQTAYFTRGRHGNCSSIYILQNYTAADLRTVRSNANFLIFFKSSPYVVEHLYRTYYSADNPSIKAFKKLCDEAWEDDFGFLVIDLTQKFKSGNRYRLQLEFN